MQWSPDGGLNRPTGKTYTTSSVTPTVTYCYDGNVTNGDGPKNCIAATPPIPLSHGRLTETRASEMLSGQSVVSLTRYTVFDALGRIQGSQQTTNNGGPYIFAYGYDLAGALTAEGYPTGRQVSTVYDDVERPTSVSGTLGQTTTPYGSSGSYAAHGSLLSIGLGNGLTESWAYNSRLQTTQVGVGAHFNVSLTYPATANNGNLSSQTITRDGSTWTQSYTTQSAPLYDGVNRLQSAQETGGAAPEWSQTYGYDAFGNRWVSSNASPGFPLSSFTRQAATNFDGGNHLLIQGSVYDLAGQQTQLGGYQSVYDAEGRVQSSTIGGAATSYVYDADGRRVMKETGSGATVFVYDASGLLAAEYPTGNAPPPVLCTTSPDHLGSTRLVTDASAKVIGCHDYLPFGEEIPAGIGGRSGSCWDAPEITQKFTGKERDAETGLDYFGARYFSGAQGRFTSADPKILSVKRLLNPQKWNKYAYTLNNLLRYFDLDGMEKITVQLRSFIQQRTVSDPLGRTFAGDNRSFSANPNASSRTSITVRVETDPSLRANPSNPIISSTSSASQTRQLDANGNVIRSDTARTGLPTVSAKDVNGTVQLSFQENTKNPLEPQALTPGISANLSVGIPQNGAAVAVNGTTSGFLAFEPNVTPAGGATTNVPLNDPAANGSGALSLFSTNPVSLIQLLPPTPPPPPCTNGACR